MNVKFTASMLAEGNHLFQASITVLDDGLILKIPNFWNNKESFFRYEDISGFRVDTPSWYTVLIYCTIYLNARGTWVQAHGFTKSDAKKIKRYIEDGQRGNNVIGSHNSAPSRSKETHEEWMERSRRDTEEFRSAIGRFAEEQRTEILERIEKVKKVLTSSLRNFYMFSHLEDQKGIDESQDQIKKKKIMLIKYLKKVGEEDKFKSILEECRKSARTEVDRDIAKIEEQKNKDAKFFENLRQSILDSDEGNETPSNFEFPDVDKDFKGTNETPSTFLEFELLNKDDTKNEFKNQIKHLTNAYDNLDVELLEDCEKVNQNKLLVETFIKNIIRGKDGREFLKKEINFIDFESYKYAATVHNFFDIIYNIYDSIAYQQSEDGTENTKKTFPFALDNQNIIDYLKNEDNSLCDRMSKLIDVTDNFIDRIAKNTE